MRWDGSYAGLSYVRRGGESRPDGDHHPIVRQRPQGVAVQPACVRVLLLKVGVCVIGGGLKLDRNYAWLSCVQRGGVRGYQVVITTQLSDRGLKGWLHSLHARMCC